MIIKYALLVAAIIPGTPAEYTEMSTWPTLAVCEDHAIDGRIVLFFSLPMGAQNVVHMDHKCRAMWLNAPL